ncbi:Oxysterol-binding protein-domain-containing protein [Peziza echinospora]|nr:Oxysterol-binding protein-domain-containing protein [Peziza echinospora]
MADPNHRRTRSTMAPLLGGGSPNIGSVSQVPSISPRHSIHGSLHSSSQSSSQLLTASATTGEQQPNKGGKVSRTTSIRTGQADMRSEPSASGTSLPPGTQAPGYPSSSQSAQKPEGKSVEETVKVFKLYEALKAGDTAFISKTLRSGLSGAEASSDGAPPGAKNQILHLAIQCAELPVIEYILLHTSPTPSFTPTASSLPYLDLNTRDPSTGNTPLHLATLLGRNDVIGILLSQPTINDSIPNFQGKAAIDLARSPATFEKLELSKSLFVEEATSKLLNLIEKKDYLEIERLLDNERVKGWLDVNIIDVTPSYFTTPHDRPGSGKESIKKSLKGSTRDGNKGIDMTGGSTLLHEAARNKDTNLIQILLLHGADPFRRDRKGKLPQDITKDEKVKAVLKKSPAAAHAQRGIEEKAILGGIVPRVGNAGADTVGEQGREMKGYLKKWTNYTGGWKLRWFVLEDGVLSYYKHQDDIGSACRGAINMRIARLYMDPQDKQRFEILGKSSVKYHLKANHVVEAKRWYWTLNNAIQWAKDEAREVEKRKGAEAERMGRLKELTIQQHSQQMQSQRNSSNTELVEQLAKNSESIKSSSLVDLGAPPSESDFSMRPGPSNQLDQGSESEQDDDTDSNGRVEPPTADSLALAANSARLQLDLLAQVCLALQFKREEDPNTPIGDESVSLALNGYEGAVKGLKSLVGDVLKMSKERDRYWKYRLGKEQELRRIWEENMQKLVEEHEALEEQAGLERGRRIKTKRALKEVLRERDQAIASGVASAGREAVGDDEFEETTEVPVEARRLSRALEAVELDAAGFVKTRRKSLQSTKSKTLEVPLDSSDEDDDDDEFFDAVDAGEVRIETAMPKSPPAEPVSMELAGDAREHKKKMIEPSMIGYEDPPRTKLAMDADDRPKISLWGILKSMIGKDMTKMTLPVSFNECTSLLQRVAEDMEYTDLLDTAADRAESTERMVYVAAFAASEYSSTINRIAKPFNPLLGETYEYARPDKGFRFFVEQVSHHPPIGAAWAESPKWDYWGESAVKSKFYGKSFDINPLGTWFLKLRPIGGTEELYSWKKVTTSVIGIITGSPTIDNYGLMEITNHTTGDKCLLDFKPRGWRVANAYEVKGKVLDHEGTHVWSVGGRWNDKIYARRSMGSSDDGNIAAPGTSTFKNQSTFLIWENHPRPPMPFNLTPFAATLNELPEKLRPVLCPTDTRLRPDQRAMEDGLYDRAADEKNRLEEKQRAKRKERETEGVEYEPRWFVKKRCQVTGEEYWDFTGEYWQMRSEVAQGEKWRKVEEIF